MSEITFTDQIDLTKSRQYTLSIRLSTDGFSFSVYNPVQNAIFYTSKEVDPAISLTANVKSVFKETDFLKCRYKRVNVLIAGKRFTFVPLDLFDEEQSEPLFYYNHTLRENEIVMFNALKKNNVVVLFAIDKAVFHFLKEQFEEVQLFAHPSPLIEYFSIKNRSSEGKRMYAYLRRKSLDVYCFDKGTLLMANSFECKEPGDRQYFILYVWKQLNFDQLQDELYVAGRMKEKDKVLVGLKRFVKEVSSIEHSSVMPFDLEVLQEINK